MRRFSRGALRPRRENTQPGGYAFDTTFVLGGVALRRDSPCCARRARPARWPRCLRRTPRRRNRSRSRERWKDRQRRASAKICSKRRSRLPADDMLGASTSTLDLDSFTERRDRRSAGLRARRRQRSSAASAWATARCRSSPACRSTSTTCTWPTVDASWICSTSSVWKCCAAEHVVRQNTLGGAVRIISGQVGHGFIDRRPRPRSAQSARLVRFPVVEDKVSSHLGLVEEARRLLRHPRLRVRNRTRLTELGGRALRARRSRQPRRRPTRRIRPGLRTPSTRIPRSVPFGSAACSVRQIRAAASPTTWATKRGVGPCRRAILASIPLRSTSSPM